MSDRGYLYYETAGVPLKTWTRGVPVEDKAMDQLHNLASLPFIHKHVAAMPDVHWGMGATIGSVIATKGAVIPAAVGVDIGCGMMAVQTTLKAEHLPDSLAGVRSAIESVVPVGFKDHGMDVPRSAEKRWRSHFFDAYHEMQREFPAVATKNSPGRQIGTLGGGNHFIEICLDEEDRVWAMLHSGSRGVGNRIGQFFIAEAKREMEKHFIRLPDKDLAYLVEGSVIFDAYVRAVEWAQDYARENREEMMTAVLDALRTKLGEFELANMAVNCHHNYVARENHFGANVLVTRKGAVRAREGDLGIIPGSMGARSFIVRGKGNRDSFQSCAHGAGRKMSRGEAKRTFSIEDHANATEGVECRKDKDVIDETPGAYKDIDAVMAAQDDLIEVVHTLKQIVCVKG